MKEAGMDDDKVITTTVMLDARTWRLLHELAMLRAERVGGRPNQSAVVRELVVQEAKETKKGAKRA